MKTQAYFIESEVATYIKKIITSETQTGAKDFPSLPQLTFRLGHIKGVAPSLAFLLFPENS